MDLTKNFVVEQVLDFIQNGMLTRLFNYVILHYVMLVFTLYQDQCSNEMVFKLFKLV